MLRCLTSGWTKALWIESARMIVFPSDENSGRQNEEEINQKTAVQETGLVPEQVDPHFDSIFWFELTTCWHHLKNKKIKIFFRGKITFFLSGKKNLFWSTYILAIPFYVFMCIINDFLCNQNEVLFACMPIMRVILYNQNRSDVFFSSFTLSFLNNNVIYSFASRRLLCKLFHFL